MKVAVLALMATMGGAFVTPAPRATASGGVCDKASAARTPTSRGETSAVSPLNVAGFSLSSITDIFTRKSTACLLLPRFYGNQSLNGIQKFFVVASFLAHGCPCLRTKRLQPCCRLIVSMCAAQVVPRI